MNLAAKKRTGIFISILVTCFVCSMLSTALTTALPSIMNDFGVNTSTGQWLTSIYSLVMGILVLASPFLVRRVPSKPLYLATLIVFMSGLILCAFTKSYTIMLIGRILQAAGNGVMVALGQVVMLAIYPEEKRGSIMGIYGLAIGGAPIVAPTFAGLIVDAYGWRMIFYMVLIITTFDNVLENEKQEFDTISLALCTTGFSCILIGIGNMGTYSMLDMNVLLTIVLGISTSCAFVFRQLHMEKPFIEIRILKYTRYRIAVIASMLMYASVVASSVLLPIYIQNICGYSATVSGFATMPGALAMAFISPFAGKYYDRSGIKKLLLFGGILLTLSNLGMVFVGIDTSLILVIALNVFRNIGIGFIMMPLVTWGMSALTGSQTSHGTALLTSLRTLAGALGSAVFVAVVTMVSGVSSQTVGMNAAFFGLTFLGGVEVILAVLVIRRNV